jgi:hypothetical protein
MKEIKREREWDREIITARKRVKMKSIRKKGTDREQCMRYMYCQTASVV